MSVTVRFAPSPTGYLHIGNARTALFNWLFAKTAGGKFILRLDDTDHERSREEFAEAIIEDLAWLGIEPDTVVRQTDRADAHDAAAARLKDAGRLYPAYETSEELERRRRLQLARHEPPIYDRAALKLTDAEKAALEGEGRSPHWRFLLERRTLAWDDLVRGHQTVEAGSMSDPVLIRGDGSYLYTLPSVVDDIDLGVTHIIRGEDHVANSAVQIEVFEALGGAAPTFAHHILLTATSGEGLSKRSGALSLRGLRAAGFEPMAVACLAVLIGTSHAVEPFPSLDALGDAFDLGQVSRAPAKFDPDDIAALNARILHATEFDTVRERLEAAGIGGGPEFWSAVRPNLERFDDVADWWRIIASTPGDRPVAGDDRAYVRDAAGHLPPAPWDETTWQVWTSALKEASGRKGKALFQPLRLALTGRDRGPEMAALLPLIGRERAEARLKAV